MRNSCRSDNHYAELVIYHFERYNIYHSKTKIIFSYPIRVSTMESSTTLLSACSPKGSGGIYIPHARHQLTAIGRYEAPNYGSVRWEFS